MTRRRRGGPVLTVLLLTGCGSAGPAEPPPELSAVSIYGRHAEVRGRVDVRIANAGPGPVEIERYRVEHPMFEPVPPLVRTSRLPPDGRSRLVPVPFGAPRCDVADPRGARVVVGLRTAAGVRDVPVPLDDGEPGLVRAHRLACASAAVTAAAGLDLAPWHLEPGPGARTALRLQRRGPGEVVVTELGGNILFSIDGPDLRPLVTLGAGEHAASVEVAVRATRCDAHALTESKRSWTFPLFASVDGAEPARVQLTVSPPGRAALQSLLDRTCGTPP